MTGFVFLCAGRGRRMRELTQDRCKAMVRTASGKSILEQSLDNLTSVFQHQDHSITVVGGYQFGRLKDWLIAWGMQSGSQADVRLNPIWAESGPLGSLLQLQDADFSRNGLCILNGDTVYDRVIFDMVRDMTRAGRDGLICSETQEFESDAILVQRNDRMIKSAGKVAGAPPPAETYLVSAGCMVLSSRSAISSLQRQIAALKDPRARDALQRNPWHSLVSLIAADTQMTAGIVPETSWREYDTPECLRITTAGMKAVAN